jgi:hypothetical protein
VPVLKPLAMTKDEILYIAKDVKADKMEISVDTLLIFFPDAIKHQLKLFF